MRGTLFFALSIVATTVTIGCGGGTSSPPPELASNLPTREAEKAIVSKVPQLPVRLSLEIHFRDEEPKLVKLKAGEECKFGAKIKFESPQEYFVLKLIYVRDGANYGTTVIKPDRLGTTEFGFQLDSMPRPQESGEFQLQVRALNQLLYEEKIVAE
jgi:hypothetical protein